MSEASSTTYDYVTLDKRPNFPEPQFPHLSSRANAPVLMGLQPTE